MSEENHGPGSIALNLANLLEKYRDRIENEKDRWLIRRAELELRWSAKVRERQSRIIDGLEFDKHMEDLNPKCSHWPTGSDLPELYEDPCEDCERFFEENYKDD